jgi:hypothetical protein
MQILDNTLRKAARCKWLGCDVLALPKLVQYQLKRDDAGLYWALEEELKRVPGPP